MASSQRRRLPPGMRKVTLASGAVRYELVVDAGADPGTGRRRQTRRRFATLDEALAAHAKISAEVDAGTYVARSTYTLDEACAAFIAGRHNLRPTSLAKLDYDLAPLRERHGALPLQALTRRHIDELVRDLVAGGTITEAGNTRRPWSPSAVNRVIATVQRVLADAHEQGLVPRNVAAGVQRVPSRPTVMQTYTPAEVALVLEAADEDRIGHAWHLALCGLRRGEIAGLRWSDVDLDAGTLTIANSRARAGSRTVEGEPKSAAGRRTLPIPPALRVALEAARRRQQRERLALGPDYGAGTYVVSNEAGEPYSPEVISEYWRRHVRRAGVRPIRLHDARHTAATALHLQGVPVAVIAAWIGHSDASFTLRTYAHSQHEALQAAAAVLGGVVTTA